MASMRTIVLVARKEVRDALRNRWFVLFAVAFAVIALAMSKLALDRSVASGFAGYGRTAASLVNLVMLIVPMLGLTLGATSLTAERESGTLAVLMAQPLKRRDVLLGKYAGLALVLLGAVALGFGLAGVTAATRGGAIDPTAYARVVLFAMLLALVMLSLGVLISAAVRRVATAHAVALFAWLGLVLFGDLGLMGTAMTMRLGVGGLFTLTLANPVETYKIAAVGAITGALDVLGPAGLYAMRTYGTGLVPLLAVILMAWILLPLLGALRVFDRKALVC
jgi:Cu-processing system permease protein